MSSAFHVKRKNEEKKKRPTIMRNLCLFRSEGIISIFKI